MIDVKYHLQLVGKGAFGIGYVGSIGSDVTSGNFL